MGPWIIARLSELGMMYEEDEFDTKVLRALRLIETPSNIVPGRRELVELCGRNPVAATRAPSLSRTS